MKIYLLLAMPTPLGAWMWMMETTIKISMLHLQVIVSGHPKGRKKHGKEGSSSEADTSYTNDPTMESAGFSQGRICGAGQSNVLQ